MVGVCRYLWLDKIFLVSTPLQASNLSIIALGVKNQAIKNLIPNYFINCIQTECYYAKGNDCKPMRAMIKTVQSSLAKAERLYTIVKY